MKRTGDLPAGAPLEHNEGLPLVALERSVLLGWSLVGLAAGTCLRLSHPPVQQPLLLLVGLTLLLWARTRLGVLHCGWLGWCAAAPWFAVAPFGLAGWGPLLSSLSWFVPSLCVALLSSLSRAVEYRAALHLRMYVFPALWVLSLPIYEAFGVPVTLSVGWAAHPEWLRIVPVVGISGTDGTILVLCAALAAIAQASARKRWDELKSALIAGAAATAILVAGQAFSTASTQGAILFHAVQPAVAPAGFRQSQNSLFDRGELESRLDRLTEHALTRPPGLVVLPEGGNTLFNARVPRRREILRQLMRGKGSELLLPSADLTPEGRLYNVVYHVTGRGFGAVARKAHPVLLAERSLQAGTPTVLRTKWGRVGISICFDSVFSGHVRDLARQGAEVLVATSDDASFGASYLAELHLAYSRLRAIEVGRSLLFLSNRGPLAAFNVNGRETFRASSESRTSVSSLELASSSDTTLACRGARWLAPLLALFLLLRVARWPFRAMVRPLSVRYRARAFVALLATQTFLMVWSLSAEGVATALARALSWSDLEEEVRDRVSPAPVTDSLSGLFLQKGPVACGPTALAFTLTLLGDNVLAEQLLDMFEPSDARGYSLSELKRMAALRGFAAEGYRGSVEDLPTPGQAPVVAHMHIGHYVTVLSATHGDIGFFDPATGQRHQATRQEFLSAWSGRYLRVGTRAFAGADRIAKTIQTR